MKLNIKKAAFTLSEIMLTLALIGFLATMTLSSIGSSVQQRSRLSQYRTALAKMSSVIKNITAEDGQMYQCYLLPSNDEINEYGLNIEANTPASNDTGCRTLTERFVRAMGATRSCIGDATEGCIPNNYPTASGCFVSYDNVGAYVLDNSMIIITDSINSLKYFAVDVNGRKGPNKFGQDIFVFSIKATESVNSRGNIFVTQLGVLPADYEGSGCSYETSSSSKSGYAMMKDSVGLKNKKQNATDWRNSDDNTDSGNGNPNLPNFSNPSKYEGASSSTQQMK